MSLARQIVMLLDLATEPLSARTLVAQMALGGDTSAEAVHRRMHQMKAAGQARKEGDGWVLVDALPLQNLRAKWAREGQPAQTITQPPAVPPPAPSLRDRIVAALRARPGITAKELAEFAKQCAEMIVEAAEDFAETTIVARVMELCDTPKAEGMSVREMVEHVLSDRFSPWAQGEGP